MSVILEDRPKFGTRRPDTRLDVIKDLFTDYVKYTNLDDRKCKRQKKYEIALSCFWILVFITCALLTFVFACKLWTKWSQSSLVIMNADTLVPVDKIPFPAVTVCLETKSKASVYNFTNNYHLYNDSETRAKMSDKDRDIFEDLTLVCDNHLSSEIGRNISAPKDSLLNLMKVAPGIDEAFFVCKWKQTVTGGCDSFFSTILTEEGICFTFNMLEADDVFKTENLHSDYLHIQQGNTSSSWDLESGYSTSAAKETYPRRGMGYGASTGLVFAINQNKEDLDYLCKGPVQGSKVLLHHPAEFPRISNQYFRTAVNEESVVAVKPQMITTSEALRSYLPERRECFFAKERELHYFKVYTQSNCEFECLTNHTYAVCDCVHIGMPRGPHMNVCNTGKVECMNKARSAFMEQGLDGALKQEHCNCLPSCTSIDYETEISQAQYDFESFCRAYRVGLAEGIDFNLLMSRVKVFFKSSQFIASQRREMYGAIDFIADCGGIIGLFMGISLLGFIKFIYFFVSRIYYAFIRRNKTDETDNYETVTNSNIAMN